MNKLSSSLLILLTILLSCTNRKTVYNQDDEITVAAYYFPNYHTGDPRNDLNMGKNWAEWELVKAAQPRFPNHQQPKVPAWGYVDEKDPEVMAKKMPPYHMASTALFLIGICTKTVLF